MSTDDPSLQDRMLQAILGFWASQAIHAAARLGLADRLHERPITAEELAQATGTHAPSLARLLRSVGLCRRIPSGGRYALTPLGETLRTGTPGSLRSMIMAVLGGEHYRAWGALLHSVETGRTAFDHTHGMPVFMTGGKERTEVEFRALLAEAGFGLTGVRPTRSLVSLVEAEHAASGLAAA